MSITNRIAGKIRYLTVKSLRDFSNSINWLVYHIENSKKITKQEREVLNRNSRFALCHKGRRAFVIGNGPSLNLQYLGLLKNEITFTCNAFYLNPILSQWQPTYHSHIDPRAFDGSVNMTGWFTEVCEKMSAATFFLHFNGRNNPLIKRLFPCERTYYCDFCGKISEELKSVNIARLIPGAESVSLFNICLAMYMGCDPIYLIGMDHDWLATRKFDTHFYQDAVVRGLPVSTDLSKISYESDVRSLLNLWEGYKNIKSFAGACKIKIYNATNGGFLDVFERVGYESLFAGTPQNIPVSVNR